MYHSSIAHAIPWSGGYHTHTRRGYVRLGIWSVPISRRSTAGEVSNCSCWNHELRWQMIPGSHLVNRLCCILDLHSRLKRPGKLPAATQAWTFAKNHWVSTTTTPGVIHNIWAIGRITIGSDDPICTCIEVIIRASYLSDNPNRRSIVRWVPFLPDKPGTDHHHRPWYPSCEYHGRYPDKSCHKDHHPTRTIGCTWIKPASWT